MSKQNQVLTAGPRVVKVITTRKKASGLLLSYYKREEGEPEPKAFKKSPVCEVKNNFSSKSFSVIRRLKTSPIQPR